MGQWSWGTHRVNLLYHQSHQAHLFVLDRMFPASDNHMLCYTYSRYLFFNVILHVNNQGVSNRTSMILLYVVNIYYFLWNMLCTTATG